MNSSVIFGFFHHLLAFTVFGSIVSAHLLISERMTQREGNLLRIVYKIFNHSFGALLLIGLARVFWFEKGWEYYGHNAGFHAKLTFIIIIFVLGGFTQGLISKIISSPSEEGWSLPDRKTVKKAFFMLRAILLLQVAIMLCAVMMSHGVGVIKKTTAPEVSSNKVLPES